ncbi:unnamed protein product [Gongylonema pulchrum]|uniref:Myosin_tail_1 domain-containing protein n=1 Tax=Gongylonema pulchrum TaxID=637853 RepID=A0A183DCD2_9BILA|nr:unnamed protein product [Gongylonema pulchrum]
MYKTKAFLCRFYLQGVTRILTALDFPNIESSSSTLKAQLEKLQGELNVKNDVVGDLEKAKNDAEWSLGEHKQWLADANQSALKAQLEEMQKELNGKNDLMGNLEKAKNDAEWNLGEHRQWLADANER